VTVSALEFATFEASSKALKNCSADADIVCVEADSESLVEPMKKSNVLAFRRSDDALLGCSANATIQSSVAKLETTICRLSSVSAMRND